MVSDQLAVQGSFVHGGGVAARPRRQEGVGRIDARGERLSDALAGHDVAGRDRVAHEEGPAGRRGHAVDPGRDRPRAVRLVGSGVGAQQGAHMGPLQQVGPELLHVPGRVPPPTLDAEPDVRPAPAERERPEVPGDDVGVERHVEVLRRDRAHAGHVLAERMPLAAVPVDGHAELASQRGPHAVGTHDPSCSNVAEVLHDRVHVVVVLGGLDQRVAVEDLCAGATSEGHEGGVEVTSCGHRDVLTTTTRQGEPRRAPVGRADPAVLRDGPGPDVAGAQTEALEQAQCAGGEPVTADLVPREGGPVDDEHVESAGGSGDRRRGSGGSGPDHEHVDGSHGAEATAAPAPPTTRARALLRPGRAGRRRRPAGTP